ncbi:hypothetical protein ABK040_004487 [Willaertia magna]
MSYVRDTVNRDCIGWVKSIVSSKLIYDNQLSIGWTKENQDVIVQFLKKENNFLFVYVENNQFKTSLIPIKPKRNEKVLYFIKDSDEYITMDNIATLISYGILSPDSMEDLLTFMKNNFAPELISSKSNWPESLQKDFLSQLHKFMANLTETYFRGKGSTVLYVPIEDIDIETAKNQKDLIQRLEAALMHWTTQIKEVISEKDSYGEHGDGARPLAEIEYWRSRAEDLINIKKQIQREDVQKIVTILSHSSYLSTFEKLSSEIQKGSDEALDNLKFLRTLKEPCERLASADPSKTPEIVPEILYIVQLINSISTSYNTSERITGLLKKISNEIIHICTEKISLSDIFNGNVDKSMEILNQSIKAGEYWKRVCMENNEENFVYDKSSVFAEIDAFVQRCSELLEVCEAQLQFGNFVVSNDNTKNGLPRFGGTRGPEITKSFVDIRLAFQKLMNDLGNFKHTILDVKSTNWHDDYKKFKSGIRDLELMMQNIIFSAFETVTDIQNGIELLEAFYSIAKRDSIKRSIELKTQEICLKFIKELEDVQKLFETNRKNPPIPFIYPSYSGSASWAKKLQERIRRDRGIIMKAYFLPKTKEHAELERKYQQVYANLEKFILNMFDAWSNSISGQDLYYKLEIPLLVKVDGLLRVNFDPSLLSVFEEVKQWQKFSNFDINEQALEISCYSEKIRLYRENVMLVARDYNSLITSLAPEESRLFVKTIKEIDRQLVPGLHTLGWNIKMHNDHFVIEARKKIREARDIVYDFKEKVSSIYLNCRKMADTILLKIENKKVYDGESNEFEKEQEVHREQVRLNLLHYNEEIIVMLKDLYKYFVGHGQEVFNEWWQFIDKVEKRIDYSLKLTVKRSLQRFLSAINGVDSEKNGDSNNETPGINRNPLFLVKVDLKEETEDEVNPGLSPNIKELMTMVTRVGGESTKVVSVVPRLTHTLKRQLFTLMKEEFPDIEEEKFDTQLTNDKNEKVPNYYEKNIESNIISSIVAIMEGMDNITPRVNENLNEWKESFKTIWSVDRDSFIRRYCIQQNRTCSAKQFELEIEKYRQFHLEIQNKDPTIYISYLQLDFTPLKHTLFMECNIWQTKLLELLHSVAQKDLEKIYELIEKNNKLLREEPRTLEMLEKKIELVSKMDNEYPKKKAGFSSLYEQFELLNKYDVKINEQEQESLDKLGENSAKFEEILEKAKLELENQKETFRMKLRANVDIFANSLVQLKSEFENAAPITAAHTFKDAKSILDSFRDKVETKKKEEEKLKNGLKIFSLQPQVYKELKDISKLIESLEKVWLLKSEWDKTYDDWKFISFTQLNVAEIESNISKFTTKINGMGREVKDTGVFNNLKDQLGLFLRVLPLIQDLKNEAMRTRHWDDLREIIKQSFDETGKEFNLHKIFQLRLENYFEDINNISHKASQELEIEKEIGKISEIWSNTNLNIGVYRENYYRLQSVEDIYLNLDDHISTLSGMKLNPFVQSFQSDVLYWERTLGRITEVIDLILLVQRQWIYLLNIFDVEDIQKQLHNEFAVFKSVNARWKSLMKTLSDNKNVLAASKIDGIHSNLTEMNTKLEQIQKQLDDYLELKRQQFPRFYFLSDDELLQILGQSKDPNAIQRYLQNLFQGIKYLKIEKSTDTRQTGFFAKSMTSKEGEQIEFNHPIPLEGSVEKWLTNIESSMKNTVKRNIFKCLTALKNFSPETTRDSWIKEWAGQFALVSSQIYWTKKITGVLLKQKEPSKILKEMKSRVKQEWNDYITNYSAIMTLKELRPIDRLKLVSLITIEVHARDIIDRLVKSKVTSIEDFEWRKHLRFYWDEEKDGCVVQQGTSEIDYDYEFIGNFSRLVVTPLTEKVFLTLTTAIEHRKGGSPIGPAGTGKSETVKDLAKVLGKNTLIINCSDRFDHLSVAKTFSGIVQTGSWSCFDEFNRLELDVLSVVAQQISQILGAISAGSESLIFGGKDIKINPTCGIFVTMNPNYTARSELPDNLKSLLRPISMIVPDSSKISEIRLISQGFKEALSLSKKIASLYSLLPEQLSRQKHYDFGLRNISSVLNASGQLKKEYPNEDEEVLLLIALRNVNLPKLVTDDIPLFNLLIKDIFPNKEIPNVPDSEFSQALDLSLVELELQRTPYLINKCLQIDETRQNRHGIILVGNSGSGKSTSLRLLQHSLMKVNKEEVKEYIINPKAVSHDELYGNYNKSRDWKDGIFSFILREAVNDQKENKQHWIIFDGPIDPVWVESMNTLLDDSRQLTLISGDRISIAENVTILFEVLDLSAASPATISRCGVVYFNENELGWGPMVKSWLSRRRKYEEKIKSPSPDAVVELLYSLIFEKKFIERALEEKKSLYEIIPTTDIHSVRSFCNLFDAFATAENGLDPNDTDLYTELMKKYLVFCLIWSIGATVDEEGRKKMDMLFREFDPQFPSADTVYDYYIDAKSKLWKPWSDKVNSSWKPQSNTPFYKIVVPTVDTVKNTFIIQVLLRAKQETLITGDNGVGKTITIQSALSQFDSRYYTTCTLNFSAITQPSVVQELVESRVEKTLDTYSPHAGKQMIIFVDDFNLPQKDEFGSQPPLELLRQFIDHGFWYDKAKQTSKKLKKIQVLAACGPHGNQTIPSRLLSRFNVINLTAPSEQQLLRIYSIILGQRLEKLEEAKSLTDDLTQASINIYKTVCQGLLPTPNKSHYLFNLKDLSKVFQGLISADYESMDSKEQILRLWVHECYRVFYDRLSSEDDRRWLRDRLGEKLFESFSYKWKKLYSQVFSEEEEKNKQDSHTAIPISNEKPSSFSLFVDSDGVYKPTLFTDLSPGEKKGYVEIQTMNTLKETVELKLKEYNESLGKTPLNLVMFNDAIEHLCRIYRILKQPRGNALLVGVGGSGRQSLTRLATFIIGYKYVEVQVSSTNSMSEFREYIKNIYLDAGLKSQNIVFLFSDSRVVEDAMFEDINSLLSNGEVPNLFPEDDLQNIYESCKKEAILQGSNDLIQEVYQYFIEKVRNHLHTVVCMSPIGDKFRKRIRMFPAIVRCCSIDWFTEWPVNALKEVGYFNLNNLPVLDELAQLSHQSNKDEFSSESSSMEEQFRDNVVDLFVKIHVNVLDRYERSKKAKQLSNYVTPSNYLSFIDGFTKLLKEKQTEYIQAVNNHDKGVKTLELTNQAVKKMSVQLDKQHKEVDEKKKKCDNLMDHIVGRQTESNNVKAQISVEKSQIESETEKANKLREQNKKQLAEVEPILEQAEQALKTIKPNEISELRIYTKAPREVENVFNVIMTILKKPDANWESIRNMMSNQQKFMTQLYDYPKNDMSERLLTTINNAINKYEITDLDKIAQASASALGLAKWALAIYNYGMIYQSIKPKKEALEKSERLVAEYQIKLDKTTKALKDLEKELLELGKVYEITNAEKKQIEKQLFETEKKLTRARELTQALDGEKDRWVEIIQKYKDSLKNLVGDVIIASAFLSYAGPFNSSNRKELLDYWLKELMQHSISTSPNFSIESFLSKPTIIREWNSQGLPSDTFSIQNGVLVMNTRKWPLMIDPQQQAKNWIKKCYGANELTNGLPKLEVTNLKDPKFTKIIENSIKNGIPTLIEDVLEDIDSYLEPIISQSIIKRGQREIIRLGDNEIEYNRNFKLYLTTKLPNPTYPPEISTKTTIVNFSVTTQGLEDQLLAILVRNEKSELEEQKTSIVYSVAGANKQLEQLEHDILYALTSIQGEQLLEDEELITKLQQSKKTSEEILSRLELSQETERKIDNARNQYRESARRASNLFFVLNDLIYLEHMYQLSLESYIDLFKKSIENSPKPKRSEQQIQQRIDWLNEYHTYEVYKRTCQGIFEKHKLMFVFHLCVKLLQSDGKLHREDYDFLLRGGHVIEKDILNPCSKWLPEKAWDAIYDIDRKLPFFHGIVRSFEEEGDEWRNWFFSEEPENEHLPSEWQTKVDDWSKMLIVRCLRPDRLIHMIKSFIIQKMGSDKYIKPVPNDLNSIFDSDSNPYTPIMFLLSQNVNPEDQLTRLSKERNIKLNIFSLGRGQEKIADDAITKAAKNGEWVFLANCHLMINWMSKLDDKLEILLRKESKLHPNFRLWLSSKPHPKFPVSLLQRCLKVTSESPSGIIPNMQRLFKLIPPQNFNQACPTRSMDYRKLFYSLTYFHSILLERSKFGTIGWNIKYDFNDADFEISEQIIKSYLSKNQKVAWDALRYLLGEIAYGGRVVDPMDSRLLDTYSRQFFNQIILDVGDYPLSLTDEKYVIPGKNTLSKFSLSPQNNNQIVDQYDHSVFLKFIREGLPANDSPGAFGQATNADLKSQIEGSNELLDSLLLINQAQIETSIPYNSSITSPEQTVLAIALDVLHHRIPNDINMSAIPDSDHTYPFIVVLLQECSVYNQLLSLLRSTLDNLIKAIKGQILMDSELEEIFNYLFDGKVPKQWQVAYPSMKPFSSWIKDLQKRIEFFKKWAETNTLPTVFLLPAFTFPSGFLTAIKQTQARRYNDVDKSIDKLDLEFNFIAKDPNTIVEKPKEGVYVYGVLLEGSGWDYSSNCLTEQKAMQLHLELPVIHVRAAPVEDLKKYANMAQYYKAPLYLNTNRSLGCVALIDLKIKTQTVPSSSAILMGSNEVDKTNPFAGILTTSDHFVKRGTALLLSDSQ